MSIALKQVFNKDKTFRPKRRFEPGTQRFELHKRAQASLSSGLDLRAAVKLPQGEDLNDWVAVHVVDFFNRINLIYGTVCEFCTEKSCPVMSGGPRYEYRWQDEHKYKKPTPLPAPQYMNLLMDWIEMQINNEDIFPTSIVTLSVTLYVIIYTHVIPVGQSSQREARRSPLPEHNAVSNSRPSDALQTHQLSL
ncbi:MOB kinase activator 3B-like isoform X2 [Cyprinus carpio]|uniref:MOB kinase activator 3B-like isoform X2 n=1 Tax=Cyprinus carpio TaxID=7962 RepID=A0A9R0A081_CYPCA|nr:MOB kinase activator 3B-like isoform X2 [Cyprinus carpio]